MLKLPRIYVSFTSVSIEGKFCVEFHERCFGKAISK